jgi:hypothetical protein
MRCQSGTFVSFFESTGDWRPIMAGSVPLPLPKTVGGFGLVWPQSMPFPRETPTLSITPISRWLPSNGQRQVELLKWRDWLGGRRDRREPLKRPRASCWPAEQSCGQVISFPDLSARTVDRQSTGDRFRRRPTVAARST